MITNFLLEVSRIWLIRERHKVQPVWHGLPYDILRRFPSLPYFCVLLLLKFNIWLLIPFFAQEKTTNHFFKFPSPRKTLKTHTYKWYIVTDYIESMVPTRFYQLNSHFYTHGLAVSCDGNRLTGHKHLVVIIYIPKQTRRLSTLTYISVYARRLWVCPRWFGIWHSAYISVKNWHIPKQLFTLILNDIIRQIS